MNAQTLSTEERYGNAALPSATELGLAAIRAANACMDLKTVASDLYERYLETYGFEEILELNELTEADALRVLVENGHISLPTPEPIDV